MVKHIALPFLWLALLALACNPKTTLPTAAWTPAALPHFDSPAVSLTPPDEEIMADMLTSILLKNPATQVLGQAFPVQEAGISQHPQFGPFLFSADGALVVVADSASRFSTWIKNLPSGKYKEAWFVALLPEPAAEQIVLSNQVEKIPLPPAAKIFKANPNGQILLTPENVAAALSAFTQWEGVHLDREKRALTFVGSNSLQNPQIAAGDLIAAYRAVYWHEAFGQPIFVDMDFNDEKESYLVTFGGGLEDTYPGQVLYSADLLLKGLSSGVDPWISEKSLVSLMCASSGKNPLQNVFCNYVKPLAAQNKKKINASIDESWKRLNAGRSKAKLIVDFAETADGSNQTGWDYVFNASSVLQSEILEEVYRIGYFTIPFMVNHRYSAGGKLSTIELLKDIFALNQDQKLIIEEARRFDEIKDRKVYATLAFASPQMQKFLRNAPIALNKRLISTINRLTGGFLTYSFSDNLGGDFSDEIKDYLDYALAVIYLMSESEAFTKEFLKLSDDDQLMVAFISSAMIVDKGFTKMINQLQYHQPLCRADDFRLPKEVKSSMDAYEIFVCKYLSKYKRTYLADLIRQDAKGKFDYKTPSEMPVDEDIEFGKNEEVKTIRYWFFPSNEVLTLADSDHLNTFLFNKPNMEAKVEMMGNRQGPFEAPDLENGYMPGITENLKIINDNYDLLAESFPVLKDLNNLVRTLAFFRWIRYYQSDIFDLTAFNEATDFGTPTPRTYPVYETVVALPDGSLMRSVGGVDLHSATQVGFDAGKINGFTHAMKSVENKASFEAGGKTYVLAPAIEQTADHKNPEPIQRWKFGNQQIEVSENHFSKSLDGKLVWSWNSQPSFSEDKSVFNHYLPDQSLRLVCDLNSEKAQKFTFRGQTAGTKLEKKQIVEAVWQQHLKEKLEELGELDAPAEVCWSLFKLPFKDAKMTATNRGQFYLFKTSNSKTVRWLGQRDSTGRYSLREVSEKEEQVWRSQPTEQFPSLGNPTSTKIIGIRLSSSVPTDSLIITDLGYRNDSLLQVEVSDANRSYRKNIFEWRQTTADPASANDWEKDKTSNILFASSVFERKKGDFTSFDLTNRAFLVESVANLRGKSSLDKKHFAIVNTSAPVERVAAQPIEMPWGIYSQRIFVLDTLGFNPSNRKILLDFAAAHAEKVFIFSPKTLPMALLGDSSKELVWLTALSEKEIQRRLGEAQQWLKKVQRIRVFNVENSVFDLGTNLFAEQSQLRSVGAFPRVLKFDTILPLLESLAKSDSSLKELDTRIAELVQKIQNEYRQKPTPQRLQIARDLEEVLFSWEEVRPLHASNFNWKNF